MADKKKSSVFTTLPPITAGALTTAAAMYPVDLLRALRMSSAAEGTSIVGLVRGFYSAHGAMGFIKQGVGPEVARATYMRVLKFFLFPVTHRALFGTNPSQGSTVSIITAAALCSLPEGFTIAPLEVAKIGLQLDKTNQFKNSSVNVVRHVLQTRGWTGLFMGYFGMQYRQTSWTAAYFASLDYFQAQSQVLIPKEWKKTQQLMGGFLAGILGAVFNTPGDVVRSAQQKKYMAETNVAKQSFSIRLCVDGVREFFQMGGVIYRAKGFGGLYAGFPIKAIHLGGSGAFLAMFIPLFKKLMGVDME